MLYFLDPYGNHGLTMQDINWFNGAVTLVVGSVAIIVFFIQRHAEKKGAATILVMDIRHTEEVVRSVLERNSFDIGMGRPVGFSNWEKNKHHFAPNLSSDEFAAFNRFFLAGSEIALARKDMRKIFMSGLEGKAAAVQTLLCSLDSRSEECQEERQIIINTSGQESYVFDPQEPKERIIKNIQVMGRLSQTGGFLKIKYIAGMSD